MEKMDVILTLGEQLKSARDKKGMSQKNLHDATKISLDTICRIEQNRNSNPTVYVIKELQKALDTRFEI